MNGVHIIGSIDGFSNFSEGNVGLQCCFKIQTGSDAGSVVSDQNNNTANNNKRIENNVSSLWILQNGHEKGETQIHHGPLQGNEGVWNHPIDIHYATTGMRGWPKIRLEIFSENAMGIKSFVGFGCYTPLPSNKPNRTQIEVVIWRPYEGFLEKIKSHFLGRRLRKSQLEMNTLGEIESIGVVHLSLQVFLSKF